VNTDRSTRRLALPLLASATLACGLLVLPLVPAHAQMIFGMGPQGPTTDIGGPSQLLPPAPSPTYTMPGYSGPAGYYR